MSLCQKNLNGAMLYAVLNRLKESAQFDLVVYHRSTIPADYWPEWDIRLQHKPDPLIMYRWCEIKLCGQRCMTGFELIVQEKATSMQGLL